MSHAGHKTVQCTCGNVIMTCRCLDPSKPVESVASCARCADKVIVEERHYEDGRIVRKVGLNGEWKAVDNSTGHTLYKQVQDLEMALGQTNAFLWGYHGLIDHGPGCEGCELVNKNDKQLGHADFRTKRRMPNQLMIHGAWAELPATLDEFLGDDPERIWQMWLKPALCVIQSTLRRRIFVGAATPKE